MSAPRASVLPPAPAQKSTTISPRLGATRWQSTWLPSSCTSMLPSRNNGCRLIAGFSWSLIPSGEYGVAAARSPSTASRSSAASREIFSGFTRRSSGAFCSRPFASASRALSSQRARRRSIAQSGSSHSTSKGCGAAASRLTEASHSASSPRNQGLSSRRFAPRTPNRRSWRGRAARFSDGFGKTPRASRLRVAQGAARPQRPPCTHRAAGARSASLADARDDLVGARAVGFHDQDAHGQEIALGSEPDVRRLVLGPVAHFGDVQRLHLASGRGELLGADDAEAEGSQASAVGARNVVFLSFWRDKAEAVGEAQWVLRVRRHLERFELPVLLLRHRARVPIEFGRHHPTSGALVTEFIGTQPLRRDAAAAGALQNPEQSQDSPPPPFGGDRVGTAVVLECFRNVYMNRAVAFQLVGERDAFGRSRLDRGGPQSQRCNPCSAERSRVHSSTSRA